MGYGMPFFPMYAAETLADGRFQAWSCEERGAWLTLVCLCWNDGDIPESQTVLGRLLHLDAVAMASAWSAIGDRFVEVPYKPGRLMSPRLEEERDKAETLSRKRAEAGLAGATARWDEGNKQDGNRMRLPKQAHGKGNATAMRSVCPSPSPSQPPSPSPSSSSAAPAEPTPPPTLGEHLSERYPRLGALVEALDAAGLGRSLPRNATTRGALDQLAARHGVEALVADVTRAPEGQSLAWYATRWAAWDFRPPSLPPNAVETTWPREMQAALSPALYPDGKAKALAVRVERVNGTLLLTGDGEWTGWAAQAAFRAFPSAEVVVNGERVYPPNQEPLETTP